MPAPGVNLATAWVTIKPSMAGVQGAVAKQFAPVSTAAAVEGQKAGSKFASTFGAGIKTLALTTGAVLAAVGVTAWLKESMAAVKQWEVINAQTVAVVKSTGGAANITAAQVHNLAQSIEGVTATQAESVQKGANMLLTFKNIRNEAGKGNDIFNQSTKALIDMSRAMGTDPQTAAIQLGKALNDPIKGISALSRVGIQFTADQTSMIKTMTESGNVMGAQKIILSELQSQFGGSGAAYAKTFEGQMYLLGDAVGDLGETLMRALMPALLATVQAGTRFFGWVANNLPTVVAMGVAVGVTAGAVGVLRAAAAVAAAGGLMQWFKATQLVTGAQWLWNAALSANPIGIVIVAITAIVAALVWFFTQTKLGQQIWTNVTTAIGNAAKWLWESVLKPVFTAIGAIWNWLYTYIIQPVVAGIILYAKMWGAIFSWLYQNAIKPAIDGVSAAIEWVRGIIQGAVDRVVIGVKVWGAIFSWLYQNAVKPAIDGVASGMQWVGGIIKGVVDFINGLIKSVGQTVTDVFGKIVGFIRDSFNNIVNFIKGPIDFISGVIRNFGKIKIPFIGGDAPGNWRGTAIGGGRTLSRVKSVLPSGLRVTSTYRTPAENRRAGGVSNSLHMDRNNPAVDIAGPTYLLDQFARRLRAMGGWRQLLWRVAGHYDHIHVAHAGGVVSRNWPRMYGDRPDERTARLQVGEMVVPRAVMARDAGIGDRGNQVVQVTIYAAPGRTARQELDEFMSRGAGLK